MGRYQESSGLRLQRGVGITSLIPLSRWNRASFGYFDTGINDNLKGLEDLEVKKIKKKQS